MKISLSIAMCLFASSTFAASLKGTCAKAALGAAIEHWADVPNPDPTLEYMPVSSEVSASNKNVYAVVLAFSDGNDIVTGKYLVTLQSLRPCRVASVTVAPRR